MFEKLKNKSKTAPLQTPLRSYAKKILSPKQIPKHCSTIKKILSKLLRY